MSHAVLVVDDEPSVCDLLRSMLERDGFQVHLSGSGEEAVKTLQHVYLDAVLADVVMPGMDGVALLEAILRMNLAVPVVLMTGYGTIDSAVEAMRMGAVDYITKPFKHRRVLDSLDWALAPRGPKQRTWESQSIGANWPPERGTAAPQMTLREVSDTYIARVLAASHGNKVHAARVLGINRRTLYRRGPGRRAAPAPPRSR